jgi:protein SCO1/2
MNALSNVALVFFFLFLMSFNENIRKGQTHINTKTSEEVPSEFEGVTIEEKLGTVLDKNLTFKDAKGNSVTIGDLLASSKPIILSLNYYRCTTLCAIQLINLSHLINGLQEDKALRGHYKVVTLSFDAHDTVKDAYEKQQTYLGMISEKDQLEWDFLVGDEENIKKLTEAVGFYYKYDKEMTPSGKVSRYLYGIVFEERDVKFALIEASENKIGSTTDRILLNCFHYNPKSGRYEGLAMGTLRIVALLTLIFIACALWYFLRSQPTPYR